MSIFISIVAYRDPWLWRTVDDCLANASAPQDLVFAIVDQSPEPAEWAGHPAAAQMRYLHLHHRYGRGPCWARSLALSYLAGEEHVLQIDSHTLFDRGWDETLITTLQTLRARSAKPLITTYPPSFHEEPTGIVKQQFPGSALVLKPRDDAVMKPDDPGFYFVAHGVETTEPVPGCHVAGGFLFAPAQLFREVPYDPALYFIGEEQSLAARAWTHGWDIFHMPDVPLYHLYHKGHGQAGRPLHWDSAEEEGRLQKWWQLQEVARARLRALLYDGADLGVYGLGRMRTLEQFAAFSGIDYAQRTVREGGAPMGLKPTEISALRSGQS